MLTYVLHIIYTQFMSQILSLLKLFYKMQKRYRMRFIFLFICYELCILINERCQLVMMFEWSSCCVRTLYFTVEKGVKLREVSTKVKLAVMMVVVAVIMVVVRKYRTYMRLHMVFIMKQYDKLITDVFKIKTYPNTRKHKFFGPVHHGSY